MSGSNSIFADDWRDSLQAHYKEVVRRNDKNTEESLISIMYDVGFREDELRQLKLEATMRAEDLADDFVPDLQLPTQVQSDAAVHPAVAVAQAEDEDTYEPEEAPIEDEGEGQEEVVEPFPTDDTLADENDESDPNAPQQMSLF